MRRPDHPAAVLLAGVALVCPSMQAASAVDSAVRRDIRRQENNQTGVSSLTGRTAGDLRLVKDEYRYNRLAREDRTKLLDEVADSLEKLADPKAAEKIRNMPWVTTQLATARQALSGAEGVPGTRRALLSASDGQRVILDELERLKHKTRRDAGAASTEWALKAVLDRQEELLEKTQELADKTLGKKKDELSPEEAAEAEKLAEEQKGLKEELDKALDELRKTAEEMKETDRALAESIEDVVQDVERQNVDEKMVDAGEEIEENQLANAQEDQEQIIDALRGAQEELAGDYQNPMAELEEDLAQMEDLAQKQEELLAEAEGLDQNSTQMDYDDLQADEANLQGDLQELMEQTGQQPQEQQPQEQGQQEPQQAMEKADQAMEKAEQALGEQNKQEATQDMQEALEHLLEARSQMAMQLAEMKQQMGMQQQQQMANMPQQPNQQQQQQQQQPKLPVRNTKEYDPTTGKTLYGRDGKTPGKDGWNVSLEAAEREVLVNAASERFPRRYEKEIIMYYRNLAGAGSGVEE